MTSPLKSPNNLMLVNSEEMARLLPLRSASIDMFRAALVSIVLTLTLGQNLALLCSVWCHPQESLISVCRHQAPTTPPSVTGSESCTQVATDPTPFVREDGLRGASFFKPAIWRRGTKVPIRSPFVFCCAISQPSATRSAGSTTLVLALRI
jgi:hypothetical protein